MGNLFPLGNFSQNVSELKKDETSKSPQVQVDFTPFNADHFFYIIRNINEVPEAELVKAIKNYIDLIVERILSNDKMIATVLANPKFVDAYCKVMKVIPINYDRKLLANKLTYEYTMVDHDESILNKFKEISTLVNVDTVQKLMRIGLNRDMANELAICRYSSRKELVNIQRLNFVMCKNSSDIFTEQMLIWVYEQLFDRVTELFVSSMFEVYLDREFDEFPEDFRDIYGNISLAILTILNNMPSISIREIIIKYIDRYIPWYEAHRVLPRFSLRSLSNDYERIVNIVDSLILEGYDVP